MMISPLRELVEVFQRKQIFFFTVVILCLLITTSCSIPSIDWSLSLPNISSKATQQQSDCEFTIGIINSQELPQGNELLMGYEIAKDEINKAGGINGCPLKFIIKDDDNNPLIASVSANQLIEQEHVPVLVGTYSSENTIKIAKIAEEKQIPLIAPNATSKILTQMGYKWTFRLPASADMTNIPFKWLESVVDLTAPPTIAVVYEFELTGTSTASMLLHEAADHGWSVLAYKKYPTNTIDYADILSQINNTNADILFITGNSSKDIQNLLTQIKEQQIKPKAIIGITGAFNDPQFYTINATTSDYVIATAQWSPNVNWSDDNGYSAKQFQTDFTSRYHTLSGSRSVQAYVAIKVVASALKAALKLGNTDLSQNIRKALSTMNDNTIFGLIRFDQYGQNIHTSLLQQKVSGKTEIIFPTQFQTTTGVFPIPHEKINAQYSDGKDIKGQITSGENFTSRIKTLYIGTQQSVNIFNPLWAGLSNERYFLREIYDTMYEIDQNGAYVPLLAQKVTRSADGKIYTFTIPANIKFSDGKPLTAQDIKFSYDLYHQYPDSMRYQDTKLFEKIEVIDDTTLTLSLKMPVPEIADKLSQLYIIPKHIWSVFSSDEQKIKNYSNIPPIGSGSFIYETQNPGLTIKMKANKDHWKRPPKIDYMIWEVFKQQDLYINALKKGQVVMIDFIPPPTLNTLRNSANIQTISGIPARPGFTSIIINQIAPQNCPNKDRCNGHAALRDVKVRQALAFATDKDKIILTSLQGHGTHGVTIIPDSLKKYYNDQISDYEFSLSKANQELDHAGYLDKNNDGIRETPDGKLQLIFNVFYPANYPSYLYQRLLEILMDDWSNIGVKIKPLAIDEGDLVDIVNPGFEHDIVLWGWGVNPDPDFILSILTTSQILGNNSETGYANPEYDLLYEEQSTELDQTKRQKIIWKMQEIIQRDVPYIIPYYSQESYAIRTDMLNGWETLNNIIMPLYPGLLTQLELTE